MDKNGYPYIYEPTFSADCQRNSLPKGWHFEHRVVAIRMIGRPLRRNEEVHHRNEVKTDNRATNLQVMTKAAHRKLHNDLIAAKLARLAEYERRYGPLTDEEIIDDVTAISRVVPHIHRPPFE